MSDTPRTDAAEKESIAAFIEANGPDAMFPSDGYDFARELEREMAAFEGMGHIGYLLGRYDRRNEKPLPLHKQLRLPQAPKNKK